ncbi:MAG: hypothetical protein KAT77_06395 [Nanoarchaeota archaeon]|nr:hypothetical protein [Nanoarchaeota archaeon]
MVFKRLVKKVFGMSSLGNVKITGLKKIDLDPKESTNMRRILDDHAGKLRKLIKNDFVLNVNLRQHSKSGNRQKWSVKMKINYPGKMISSEEHAWTLEEALHKSFKNLEGRAKNYFRGNVRGQNLRRQPKPRKKV